MSTHEKTRTDQESSVEQPTREATKIAIGEVAATDTFNDLPRPHRVGTIHPDGFSFINQHEKAGF